VTQPLVDADAAAQVGQAPRFVSAPASAQGSAQATLLVAPLGWLLGLAILILSGDFASDEVATIAALQGAIGVIAAAPAMWFARRGAAAPAAQMPAGVMLVPRTESRKLMQRTSLVGMCAGLALLTVLAAGSNPSLLGGWSMAMIGIGLGQRTRSRALLAREAELGKSLWMPERRTAELPRLVAGAPDPEITRG
jgi:hypothetical protein